MMPNDWKVRDPVICPIAMLRDARTAGSTGRTAASRSRGQGRLRAVLALVQTPIGPTPHHMRAKCHPRSHLLQATIHNSVQIPVFVLGLPTSQSKGSNLPSSIIEEDLIIEGDVSSSEGSVVIKGRVVGDVSAEAITVQVSGSVDGALSAKKIAIEGKHKGSLSCEYLKLASTSQVQADIVAMEMETESGATLKGKVKITGRQ